MVFALVLALVALFAYGLVDIVTTPRRLVRTLPKPVWLVIVFLPLVGPLAWLFVGRPPRRAGASPSAPPRRGPDDDEDFLRDLRRRAEDQRRRARDPREDDA